FQVEVSHMKDRGVSANSKLVIAIYIIHFIILLVNLFTGFLYTVDFETGTYSRTGPFWISLLPGVLIFMISCYYLFSRNVSRKLRFGILVINLIPFVCGLIQVFTYGISIAYIGMLLAIALLYVSIQVNLKRDLEDARTSLMVSQINPHFVFNTLATIEALCESDPKLASKTINNFSKYLRCNMAVMDQNAPIPLLTEIEQVKMYASICMLRFDNIHIEYDLKDTDFYIPSLTVQPLVENAMRHGLRAKEDALVTVRSYQKDKFHIVEVEDNGIGFDLKAVKADSKLHIGLKNVEERLINMSSGKMIVQSQPGKGTLITMKIPLSKN
ncbi:MAG: histidine kinase, partial [Treponemataceae bacterium]|nr:histidine kinase [Treponemataceae bacterium]